VTVTVGHGAVVHGAVLGDVLPDRIGAVCASKTGGGGAWDRGEGALVAAGARGHKALCRPHRWWRELARPARRELKLEEVAAIGKHALRLSRSGRQARRRGAKQPWRPTGDRSRGLCPADAEILDSTDPLRPRAHAP